MICDLWQDDRGGLSALNIDRRDSRLLSVFCRRDRRACQAGWGEWPWA